MEPMFPTPLAGVIAASVFLTGHALSAVVYGFEDLIVPSFTAVPVPDGYGGATWTDLVLRRTTELNGTGLNDNDTSNVLATATGAAPTLTFAQPTVFDGAFVINPQSTVSFSLYLNNALVFSGPTRAAGNASYFASGYSLPVDRIVFNYPSYGISIDDVGLTAVPEAGTPALIAACGLLTSFRRRRRMVAPQ